LQENHSKEAAGSEASGEPALGEGSHMVIGSFLR
jgi:hypothetical protein